MILETGISIRCFKHSEGTFCQAVMHLDQRKSYALGHMDPGVRNLRLTTGKHYGHDKCLFHNHHTSDISPEQAAATNILQLRLCVLRNPREPLAP